MEKRIGRPPKSGGENLSAKIMIRLMPSELVAYDHAAERAGLGRSEWIRLVLGTASKRPLKPETPKG